MRRPILPKIWFAVATTALGFIPAFFVSADSSQSASNALVSQVAQIFTGLLGLSVLLAAITIAFGGVSYLISLGRGSIEKEGIEWIKSGVTGLVIVMGAWTALWLVNPAIFSFNFLEFQNILSNITQGGTQNSNAPPNIIDYNEIPLGKLTENLLTGKMDCYTFDAEGNPIASPMTDDKGNNFLGPTYTNHDRIDCYQQLADAAEKKALEAENLANAIALTMQSCKCATNGNCTPGSQNCTQVTNPRSQTDCSPYNTACKLPSGFQNSNVGTFYPDPGDNSLACCPDNVKLQIKGYLNRPGDGKKNSQVPPFSLPLTEDCPSNGTCANTIFGKYYGLDEFNNILGTNIASQIEETATVAGQTVTYIDLGQCPICTSATTSPQSMSQCLATREQCLQDPTKSAWGKLNIAEQIEYLQEKMSQIRSSIQQDQTAVTKASTAIANCPTVESYIDLTNTDNSTNNKATLLNINHPFYTTSSSGDTSSDPANIASYCNGFTYDNSQCFNNCNDQCPITKASLGCYQGCTDKYQCDSTKMTAAQYQQCVQKNQQAKATCVNTCRNNQPCSQGSPSKNFGTCMSSCNNNCQSTCALEYLGPSATCSGGSDQYNNCMTTCQNNSQCLQNNLQTCVVNPSALANCQTEISNGTLTSTDDINQCIASASLCPNGSDQNAGYPDCVTNPTQNDAYSGSDLYQNPQTQQCQYPAATQGYTDNQGNPTTCLAANPQTAKCPASSQCPFCPCNSLKATFKFSLEQTVNPQETNSCSPGSTLATISSSAGITSPYSPSSGTPTPPTANTCTTTSKPVNAFTMVGPECTDPAFNGDPDTFYCRQDFWNSPITQETQNIGTNANPDKNLVCSPSGEIPIGQTTDDSVTWATNMLTTLQPISTSVQNLLSFFQQLANAKEYCSCNSTYADGNPVCQACCNYSGGSGSLGSKNYSPGTCQQTACTGNSCQQMINWLQLITNYHRDIKSNFDDLFVALATETRSDVLKELTYSRNQTTQCSSFEQENGAANVSLLSCQRILDDIVYPQTSPSHISYIPQQNGPSQALAHYCYGVMAGTITATPSVQTDNWFCCTTTNEVPKLQQAEGQLPQ